MSRHARYVDWLISGMMLLLTLVFLMSACGQQEALPSEIAAEEGAAPEEALPEDETVDPLGHGDNSLPNSNFEIDTDANLKVDHVAPSIDWLNGGPGTSLRDDAMVQEDEAPGQNDNSFGQGTKEDTGAPTVVAGSIPPNKSDLEKFGVLVENNANGEFVHLFWTRVQDPKGTTNMDFEFNQSEQLSSNGITPVRTAGDLLLRYELSKGGTTPVLFLSRWLTAAAQGACEASNSYPCWGDSVNLTANDQATGSINTSAIPATESGDPDPNDPNPPPPGPPGLGSLSARTFGEASINLAAIFTSPECVTFGSAYLKSRSSDSFTAALKDFIAPQPVNISNCGVIEVEKLDDDDPANPLAGAVFELYADDGDGVFEKDGDDAPVLDSCTTGADGKCAFTNADIFEGTDYWVYEVSAPSGHDLADPRQQLVTDVVPDTTVSVTFVNPRQTGSILVEKRDGSSDGPLLAGAGFTIDPGTPDDDSDDIVMTEGATGVFCSDGLFFGDYTVSESTVPDGYSGSSPQQATVSSASTCAERTGDPPDTPDLVFVNLRNPGAILVVKTTKDAGAEGGTSPLAGAEFVVTDSADVQVGTVTTNADGFGCVDGVAVGDTYTVTESSVPEGYALPDPAPSVDVTVSDDATCAAILALADPTTHPDRAEFTNDPLSQIQVIFTSLAGQGVTVASISCVDGNGDPVAPTMENGDPDPALDDENETYTALPEGTYTCTVVIDP